MHGGGGGGYEPTNEQKIAQLQKSCPGLTVSEAKVSFMCFLSFSS